MARTRNPRRIAHETIKRMRRNIDVMHSTWGGPRHTANADGRWGIAPVDMQPENRIEDWARLAEFMDAVARQAQSVRAYAIDQVERLGAGEE